MQETKVEAQAVEPVLATRRTGPTIATALRQPLAVCLNPKKKTATDPEREIVTVQETLRYRFSPREKESLSDAMSRTHMEIARMEESLSLTKKQFKNDIAAKQAELKEIVQKHYAGFEMREVDCHLIRDYRDNTVRIIRIDTLELVSERAMTADERQRGLGL